MKLPGKELRKLRLSLGLTMRDVEAASRSVVRTRRSRRFLVLASRLSEMENKHIVPAAERLYTLSVLYRRPLESLLAFYRIPMRPAAKDRRAAGRTLRLRRS